LHAADRSVQGAHGQSRDDLALLLPALPAADFSSSCQAAPGPLLISPAFRSGSPLRSNRSESRRRPLFLEVPSASCLVPLLPTWWSPRLRSGRGGGGMSLNQAPISAQRDRSSSLNLIPANKSASFGGEADNSRVFDSQKNENYIPGKPDLGTPLWLVDRDARDRAAQAKLVKAYEEARSWNRADKVASCRSDFVHYACPTHDRWTHRPFTCKDRLCPPCQRDVSARLLPVVQELIGRMRWPLFGTLTVSNLRHLEAADLDKIRESFTRLRHRRCWVEKCSGAIYVIQVTHTRNRDGSWNLHLHFVADIEFWASEDLSREWLAVLPREWQESIRRASARAKKPFHSIVKIRRVGPKHTPGGEYSPEKVAQEMTKYFVKGLGVLDSPNAVAELAGAIKGKRLFGAVGRFYGEDKKIREALRDEAPSPLDCPDCLAAGREWLDQREGAGMVWMGKTPASDMERSADGGWVLKPGARFRLMADFVSREVARDETRRPFYLVPVKRPPPILPGALKAVASPRPGGNGKGVNLFSGI